MLYVNCSHRKGKNAEWSKCTIEKISRIGHLEIVFFLAFEAVSKLQERVPIKLKMSKCQSDKINSNKTKLVNERVKKCIGKHFDHKTY